MDKIKASQFADLAYLCKVPPFLPAEYQRLEYLQSSCTDNNSGSIHIVTGITYYADFEIELMRTDNSSTKFAGISGTTCLQRSSNGNFVFYNSGGSYYNTSASITQRTICAWKDNKIYINGAFVTNFSKTWYTGYQFHLYGAYGSNYYNNIRIYYCKMWYSDGTLVRDMYPCRRRSDSVLGFYDKVTNAFITPTGNGSLIAGNDVT